MTTSTTARRTEHSTPTPTSPVTARLAGAVLALAVAAIHVLDQGGFPGDKSPRYIGIGYYLLEAAAVLVALGLLFTGARIATSAWVLAVGVTLGPILGFVLSRGPGLPAYTDDKGNWTEPIGITSLLLEGVLLVLATAMTTRSQRSTT